MVPCVAASRTLFRVAASLRPLACSQKSVAFTRSPLAYSRRAAATESFVFTEENFKAPKLPAGLAVRDVPLVPATNEALKGLGYLVHDPDEHTVEGGTFEIKQWPQPGWRKMDPGTGDEAGTTEGDFEVEWQGDFFQAQNLAISTTNNKYLDGLGAMPEHASRDTPTNAKEIYLWMSDYHPDGGQLFWPRSPVQFVVCLGPNTKGDDIKPEDMRAFIVPEGKGVYIHPGTWHNGIYVAPEHCTSGVPRRFLTRQGKVHGRISASWANEFQTLLRVPLHL